MYVWGSNRPSDRPGAFVAARLAPGQLRKHEHAVDAMRVAGAALDVGLDDVGGGVGAVDLVAVALDRLAGEEGVKGLGGQGGGHHVLGNVVVDDLLQDALVGHDHLLVDGRVALLGGRKGLERSLGVWGGGVELVSWWV